MKIGKLRSKIGLLWILPLVCVLMSGIALADEDIGYALELANGEVQFEGIHNRGNEWTLYRRIDGKISLRLKEISGWITPQTYEYTNGFYPYTQETAIRIIEDPVLAKYASTLSPSATYYFVSDDKQNTIALITSDGILIDLRHSIGGTDAERRVYATESARTRFLEYTPAFVPPCPDRADERAAIGQYVIDRYVTGGRQVLRIDTMTGQKVALWNATADDDTDVCVIGDRLYTKEKCITLDGQVTDLPNVPSHMRFWGTNGQDLFFYNHSLWGDDLTVVQYNIRTASTKTVYTRDGSDYDLDADVTLIGFDLDNMYYIENRALKSLNMNTKSVQVLVNDCESASVTQGYIYFRESVNEENCFRLDLSSGNTEMVINTEENSISQYVICGKDFVYVYPFDTRLLAFKDGSSRERVITLDRKIYSIYACGDQIILYLSDGSWMTVNSEQAK